MNISIENVYQVLGLAGTWILISIGFLCGLTMLVINIIAFKRG